MGKKYIKNYAFARYFLRLCVAKIKCEVVSESNVRTEMNEKIKVTSSDRIQCEDRNE